MINVKMAKSEITDVIETIEKWIPMFEQGNAPAVLVDVMELLDSQQAEIERLKDQQPKWIPVSEGLPEEHDTIFAKLKGTDKWCSAMFEKMSDDVRIVVVFSDGTRRVSHSHTVDGKWECEKSPVKRTVTHWMPNPAMPKEGEQE